MVFSCLPDLHNGVIMFDIHTPMDDNIEAHKLGSLKLKGGLDDALR
jgi:hypothetical protein